MDPYIIWLWWEYEELMLWKRLERGLDVEGCTCDYWEIYLGLGEEGVWIGDKLACLLSNTNYNYYRNII